MRKRVVQFFKNILYIFMESDEKFINSTLTESEQKLFRTLKKSEQIHSELVTKAFIKSLHGKTSKDLVKAVLLHDIGKVERPLHLIEKSVAVLLHKTGLSGVSYIQKRPFMMSYLHHAERGADLLLSESIFKKDSMEEQLIRIHHETTENLRKIYGKDSEFIRIHTLLKEADDCN